MTSCPLCSAPLGGTLLVISEPDRFERAGGVSEAGYRRVWRECTGCRAAIDCLPPASAACWDNLATHYYEIDFGGGSLRGKYDRVMAFPPERSDNAGRVERIRSVLGDVPRRALDIGAGLGVFLSAFLRDDWQGVAVEPDPLAAGHLRSLGRCHVVEGLFHGQPELAGFGLVTLNKVIEHIADPKPLLRDAAGALDQPKGVLYVEVPDRLTIGRRPPSDNILGSAHRHLHTPDSLARLLADCDLVPWRVERVVEPSGKITVFAFASTREAFSARVVA